MTQFCLERMMEDNKWDDVAQLFAHAIAGSVLAPDVDPRDVEIFHASGKKWDEESDIYDDDLEEYESERVCQITAGVKPYPDGEEYILFIEATYNTAGGIAKLIGANTKGCLAQIDHLDFPEEVNVLDLINKLLSKVNISESITKRRNKTTLKERKAYNAGYRAALREDAADFDEVKETLSDLLYAVNLGMVANIKDAAKHIKDYDGSNVDHLKLALDYLHQAIEYADQKNSSGEAVRLLSNLSGKVAGYLHSIGEDY